MPDGSIYVVTSYVLTALVLVGYAVRLAARARQLRRRRRALARLPEIDAGVSTRPVAERKSPREPSHV